MPNNQAAIQLNGSSRNATSFHSTLDFDRLMLFKAFEFNSLILAQPDGTFERLRA
jgi:hypothetical protein